MAVLFVLFPVPFVLSTIGVVVFSEAMSLIILPLPFINIPISMYKSPPSIGLIEPPVAFINRAIGPYLLSLAVPDITVYVPLALVPRTVVQGALAFLLSVDLVTRLGFVIDEGTETSLDILD